MITFRTVSAVSLAALLSGAAVTAAAGGGGATPDSHTCVPPNASTTLVRNVFGRIYTTRARASKRFFSTPVFVCSTRSGLRRRLGTDIASTDSSGPPDPGEVHIRSLTLSRVAAAWVVERKGGHEIREMSLRSGRIIRRASANWAPFLVQSDAGYLAWVDRAPGGACEPCTVHLYNPLGNRVIASSDGIDPLSIGKSGGGGVGVSVSAAQPESLYWVDGGSAQFRTFKR